MRVKYLIIMQWAKGFKSLQEFTSSINTMKRKSSNLDFDCSLNSGITSSGNYDIYSSKIRIKEKSRAHKMIQKSLSKRIKSSQRQCFPTTCKFKKKKVQYIRIENQNKITLIKNNEINLLKKQ
jgi:hypothetical protein